MTSQLTGFWNINCRALKVSDCQRSPLLSLFSWRLCAADVHRYAVCIKDKTTPPRVIGVTDKEFPSGPALVEFRGAWEGRGEGGIIEKEKDKSIGAEI
jgi:hypothetical protein